MELIQFFPEQSLYIFRQFHQILIVNLLEEVFRSGAKALILCNPSNPCGKVFTRKELENIAELAIKYDAYVITDEVYEHIIYEPHKHVYMATLPGMREDATLNEALTRLETLKKKVNNAQNIDWR